MVTSTKMSPVSILGLVDDMIGVSTVGYRAHQMNAVLNDKSAKKRLQFGVKKCKTMIISKCKEIFPTNQLTVDNLNVEHVENSDTGNSDLVENFKDW